MSNDELRDPVTGEELQAFSGTLADGRPITVNARDEETARALMREQGGTVGVLSVEAGAGDADMASDEDAPEFFDPDGATFRDAQAPQDDGRSGTDASPSGVVAAGENLNEGEASTEPSGTAGEPVNPSVNEAGQTPTPQDGDNA